MVEVYGTFSKHLGPRVIGAGISIQFHYNQVPGVHFKVEVPAEYRDAILKGLADGMASRFPEFPASGSIWITRLEVHPVNSSSDAFYHAARMVIDQAFSLACPVEAK
ncbi:MAG TPA: hypothetical protein VGG19_04835 [Tepidisphaeraceae bacterium]|jgi:hypothetical protein